MDAWGVGSGYWLLPEQPILLIWILKICFIFTYASVYVHATRVGPDGDQKKAPDPLELE